MGSANRLKLGLFGANCSSGRGHHGTRALVRELARLRQTGADGGPSRDRIHAAERTLEGIWRRHRLPGRDMGDGGLSLRPLSQDQAAHCVRNRAPAAARATDRRQRVRHRRSSWRRALRPRSRVLLERRGIRDVRRATLRDHETRYDYAQEWLDIVKLARSQHEEFDFDGRFFKLKGVRAALKPYGWRGRWRS